MSMMFRTASVWQVAVTVMLCTAVHGDAVTSAAQDYGSGLGIWNANPAVNDPGAGLGGGTRYALSGEANASEYGYSYNGAATTLDRGASYANVLGYEPVPVPQYGQKSGVESSAAMAYPGNGLALFPNSPAAFPGDVSNLLEYSSHAVNLSQGVAAGARTSPSEALANEDSGYANPVFPSTNDPGRADSAVPAVTIVPEPATLALVGIALAGWISSKLRHRLIRT
jgi:hypothetical protein